MAADHGGDARQGAVDEPLAARLLGDHGFAAALDALFDNVTVARSVRDGEGRIVDFEMVLVNAPSVDGAGRGPREMIGRRVLELYPGWIDGGLWDRFRTVVETGEGFVDHRIGYRDRTAEGVAIEGHWSLSATRFGDGYLAVSRDVSAIVREERERHEAARELERSRMALDLLQRAALPLVLPSPRGAVVAARHLPAGGEQPLGGDWYDAFMLDGGRLALVIADVAGHGPDAAAHVVQLRSVLRALAVEHEDPEAVLARANAVVSRVADRDLHATCCYAVLDTGRRSLRWASAGHLPLVRVGAGASFLEAPAGLPLGVEADAGYVAHRVALDVGDRVVAFTDGLVESRGEDLGTSLDALCAVLSARGASGAQATVDALVGWRRSDADDLAVLCVELVAPQSP